MTQAIRKLWDRDEQLLALRLYNYLPFGQLHQTNPDVVKLAKAIGRTPSAVAMKACNFASLDPALKRKGLGNISRADALLWEEFTENSEDIADAAEKIHHKKVGDVEIDELQIDLPTGATETTRLVKVRRVQSFFRQSVLVSYGNKCAVTGITEPKLLIASHIIPWKDNEKRRADPTNGIALNALHDKLFDQGLMIINENYKIVLSDNIKAMLLENDVASRYFDIENKQLTMPERFRPDPEALDYHRNKSLEKFSYSTL